MTDKSNINKVAKGLSSQTLLTIVSGIEAILYFSIMSRLLSREDFGLFAAVSAVTLIFSSISTAGIGSALIQRKDMTEDFKNTSFTLSLLSGVVLSIILAFSSGSLARLIAGEQMHYPLMLMSITILIEGIISVNISWMYRYLLYFKAGMVKFSAEFISSVLSIMLAVFGYGLYAIIFKVISKSVLTLFFSFFFVNTRFHLKIQSEYVKYIFYFGGWLTASVVINNISSQIDRLLMSNFVSVNALGTYNRPKEFISKISDKINEIFDVTLFPILSGIQDQKITLRNAFNRSQYLMNIGSMGLALTFICNTELLIRIFFGAEWMDLKMLFQLLSIAVMFSVNGRLGDCYIRSLGLVRQQFNLRLIGLALNTICILSGFRFGIMGVAVGLLLSSASLIAIKNLYLAKVLDITTNRLMRNVFGGWRYGLYFIPLIASQYYLIPNSWYGNIFALIIFMAVMILLLLVFPTLVGSQYRDEMQIVIMKIKSKYANSSCDK